jgi:hypothetical protein
MFTGTFGSNTRFAILEVSGTSDWKAYVNGAQIGSTLDLGFVTGYAVARGEYNFNPITMNMTWGPSGSTAWQYTDNFGTSYTTITGSTSASAITSGSGFSVGTPPSPFSITR